MRGGSLATRCFAVALVVVSIGALGKEAWSSLLATSRASDDAQVVSWERDAAYYRCLEVETASLVAPGRVVAVAANGPGTFGIYFAVVAMHEVLTTDTTRHVTLGLVHRPDPVSCAGGVVMERYPGARTRFPTRGYLPGDAPPPATPL